MGATEEIANFVVNTQYSDIPPEAIDTAKTAILDCVGVTLAGSVEPGSKIIVDYVKEIDCKPETGIIAKGRKTAAPLAALANGTMGHILDYDDAIGGGGIHPTVPVLPVVLALGEKLKLSGKQVLLAYNLGVEVGTKIFMGLGRKHYEVGWHATSTAGIMGAAAAAAKLIGLNADEITVTLGIAASQAAGIRQNFGTMTKPYHVGCAARNAIESALLAQKGFTADASILEAPLGYYNVFAGQEESGVAKICQHLGNPFSIVSPGVTIKIYPACLAVAHAVDAILYLVKRHNISADDVDEVICKTPALFEKILIHSRPATANEGKFSMEYCMAIAILDKEMSLGQFSDEKVLRPEVQRLIPKVKCSFEDVKELRNFRHTVTVRLQDGTEFCHEVRVAKGDPCNPLSHGEIANKFRDCAQCVVSLEDTERCLELLTNLESLYDISQLMDLLTFAKGS